MTDNGMIKAHKGDDAEAFPPPVSLCCFSKGFIRGQRPFIVLRRRLPVSLPVLFYLSP